MISGRSISSSLGEMRLCLKVVRLHVGYQPSSRISGMLFATCDLIGNLVFCNLLQPTETTKHGHANLAKYEVCPSCAALGNYCIQTRAEAEIAICA